MSDQALSSLTNVILAIIAARLLDADEFGGFAAALAVYLLAVGAARAVAGELLVVRHGAGTALDEAPAALGAVLGIGLVGTMVVGTLAFAFGGPAGDGLGALALLLPGLLLQDTLRYLFVAAGRPSLAFGTDLVWTVAQLGAVAVVVAADADSVTSLVLAWGLAGNLAAAVALVRLGRRPRLSAATDWFRSNRGLWPRYLVEFGATMGAWQATLLVVGGVAGLAALGGLRAAQVLYGPLHVVYYGARLAVVPEGVRDRAAGRHDVLSRALTVGAVLAGVALAWTAVVSLLPTSVGETLLGDSWADTAEVRLPFGLFMVTEGAVAGAIVGLRILVAARSSLRAALVAAGSMVTLATLAALGDDITAVGWSLVAAGAIATAAWWMQLRSAATASTTVAGVPPPRPSGTVSPESPAGE